MFRILLYQVILTGNSIQRLTFWVNAIVDIDIEGQIDRNLKAYAIDGEEG